MIRLAAAHALGIVVLTYYGVEVCPYLESLDTIQIALPLTIGLGLALALRLAILGRMDSPSPYAHLVVELSLWIAAGLAITAWNVAGHRFPLGSGLKLSLGCLTLGLFSAAHLALAAEWHEIERHRASGQDPDARGGHFLSVSTRFMVFFLASLAVVAGVLLLLIGRDMVVLDETLPGDAMAPIGAMVREILVVFAVLMLATVVVARSYSRNLRRLFDLQLSALRSVEGGDYEARVPVATGDEFGLLAAGTNHMILELRERERIKNVFGKFVSPAVARAVLAGDDGGDLGGRQADVAILFVDIRDYTALSERLDARQVVEILNGLFRRIVEAVHGHGGVLDKFIGDAAMAVFGLDGPEAACQQAVEAALDIRRTIAGDRAASGQAIEVGIGIDFGRVVAGNIGSPERLEFTVIGDPVNTASRLQGLTRELGHPIAISASVRSRLDDTVAGRCADAGNHRVKGKAEPVAVFSVT